MGKLRANEVKTLRIIQIVSGRAGTRTCVLSHVPFPLQQPKSPRDYTVNVFITMLNFRLGNAKISQMTSPGEMISESIQRCFLIL